MKRTLMGLMAMLAFLSVSFAAPAGTFTGEIMDSQCALLGGHDKMIQKGESPKECTVRCVSLGGKYALFDPTAKKGYQLDDQTKAAKFAGAKVTVTGTYDEATKTIHVTSIKPAS
jgi:type 1 fimbria pilin